MSRALNSVLSLLSQFALFLSSVPAAAYPQTVAQHAPSPPGVLINVASHHLHLYCTGRGTPTVLLEAGAGDFSFDWSLVQPSIASVTRVCSYDRAGYAWSEPGPSPRTIRQIAAELRALLTNAHEPPPYVLVGHSLGGLYVRLYAVTHPAEVAGLVLIEATHEDNPIMLNGQVRLLRSMSRGRQIPAVRLGMSPDDSVVGGPEPQPSPPTLDPPYDKLPPDVQRVRLWAMTAPRYVAARSSEFDYLPEEMKQIYDQRAQGEGSLEDLPLVVLTRKDAPPDHAARQADLATLSRNSKLEIATTTDHHIQLADPESVVRATTEVVAAVRQNAPLTPGHRR
ncbi:MAG TPA: alpha/beta hydrolase [bacterium]|nr:alpha/beta hydrolase [bacterium]